jgi:DNA-binding CsgD family transcriptional regulator
MPHTETPDPSDGALGLGGPLIDALGQMPVPIWLADRLAHIRWMSAAATSLLGSQTGSHFSRFIAPESVSDVREMFARTVVGGLDSTVQLVTLSTSLGAVPVELASVPVRDGGEVIGVIALVRGDAPESTARRRPRPRLTPRQHQVLELLAHGRSTAEMAELLQISEDTVRNHIRYLLAELRVRTRLEAVIVAFRNEWL